ncbi:MAG TPA: IS200/IS605 family transposase [Sediminibacterium sp.]
MPNTYSQLYIQFVFAVKYRKALLNVSWDERLRLYITAIVQNNGHKMLCINNVADHIHLFIGMTPAQSASDLMRIIKADSTKWINSQYLIPQKFSWQEGFGAFSYSHSHIDRVVRYIHDQQEHHRKAGFIQEYRSQLDHFGIG